MTTVNIYEPCLSYEVPFDDTGESKDTRKIYVGNRNFYMRVLRGNSTEELLFTIKDFEHKAEIYTINAANKVNQFKKILGPSALHKWANMERARANPIDRHTPWLEVRRDFIRHWVEDPNARATLLASFIDGTKRFRKPTDTEVNDHEERITIICDYIDMLADGNTADLTERERTNIFFNTFPKSWQEAFQETARDLTTATTRQIMG